MMTGNLNLRLSYLTTTVIVPSNVETQKLSHLGCWSRVLPWRVENPFGHHKSDRKEQV